MAPRPTEFPRWATGGTAEVTEPSEEEKDSGHIPQTILHAALANWLQKLVYDWLLYLDGDRVSLTTATMPTQAKPGTAAAVGVATEAARADHVHNVPSGVPAPLTVGGSAATGTATTVALSDHVHAMPGVATTSVAGFFAAADKARLDSMATDAASLSSTAPTQVTVTTAAAGSGTTAARADHVHSVATAAPASLGVGGTNAPGTSASLARADHVHATATAGIPVALTLGGANGAGGAATVALSDHVHALPATAAPVTLTVGGTPAAGIAVTLPRSDHVHGMPGVATIGADGFLSAVDKARLDAMATGAAALTSSAPTQISVTTAAVGSDTGAAHGDHVHSVSTGVPADLTVGGSSAGGSATSLARSDHQHGMIPFGASAGTLTQGNDARLSDDRTASGLRTATTVVSVSAAPAPAAGAVLTASSGTSAAWQAPLALSGNTPAAVATAGSAGVATSAAHSDHVHAHGAQTDGTLHAAATTSVSGFLSASDKTRIDGMATGAAALTALAPASVGTTAAVGVGTTAARSDHVHAHGAQTDATLHAAVTTSVSGFMLAADKVRLDGMATGAAALGSSNPAGVDGNASPSAGVATTAARSDHRHTVLTGSPAALTIGGAAADGASNSLARTDHAHAMPGLATGAVSGFMPAADSSKLSAIEAGAQVVTFARVQTALAAATSAVSFNAQRLSGVADPSAPQDVATKAYTDAIAQGLDTKASVRLVATSNVAALTGAVVIDGVTTAADRVLLTAQSTPSANGLYLTSAGGAWARTTDADTSAKVTSGLYVFATEGTANADSGWALITPDPIVLGTTALTFTQVSGAGQITAGAGMVKAGNTLNVGANGDGSIVVNANDVQVGVITDAQHGNRGSGSLHVNVTTTVNGFMTAADKVRLDGMATNAAAVLSVTPVAVDAGTGSGGSAATASRSDHRHQVSTAAPVALAVGGTNNAGTLFTIARSDHVHAMPALATTSVDGFFAAADKTRLDGMATGAAAVGSTNPVGVDGNSNPSAGVATTAARSDHRHTVLTGSPVALTMGTAAADGTSNSLARTDHRHALPAAAIPVALTLAGANAQGSAATLALSDHVHALPATAAPAALTVGAASSAGVAVTLPRSDHVHAMPGTATTSTAGFISAADKILLDNTARGISSRIAATPTTPQAGEVVITQNTTAITFPASPQDGDTITVLCHPGEYDVEITVTPKQIQDPTGQFGYGNVLDLFGDGSATWTYDAASGIWLVRASFARYDPSGVSEAIKQLNPLTLGGNIDAQSYSIFNLAAPVGADYAANKGYVDTTAQTTLDPSINGYRIAPTVDDTTADGTFSTIYLAPVNGDKLALYDTTLSLWRLRTPSAVSLALTGRTTDLPFDVFAYWDSPTSTVKLEVLNWTTATARATPIVRQNGVWTKSGDPTRRYLGSVRPRSATTYRVSRVSNGGTTASGCMDYWNVNNRKPGAVDIYDDRGSHSYTSSAWRQWGGTATCQIELMAGIAGENVSISAIATANNPNATGSAVAIGIGLNSTNDPGASIRNSATIANASNACGLNAGLSRTTGLGPTTYVWLQSGGTGVNFFGVTGGALSGFRAQFEY